MPVLKSIRAACIAANPEIAQQEVIVRTREGHSESFGGWEPRPIRLADVLLTIEKKQVSLNHYGDGKLWILGDQTKHSRANSTWISFIASLA